jgi:general secretion pathway protein D
MKIVNSLFKANTARWFLLAVIVSGIFVLGMVGTTPGYAQKPAEEPTFSGTLLDIPLNQVLSQLGDTFGVGLVASKGATGNVNISLNNANLEQALDSITEPNGWKWIRNENTITIMTKAEFDEYMKTQVISKTFNILNANAQDIQNAITPMLSTAGKVIRDDRTNSLQITDTPESVSKIEQIILSLDVPIEVEIFPIKYAVASDIKSQADKLKTAKGDIQVDERTNSLIVTDVPSVVEKIAKLVESLDVETQVEVFDIKYAKPKDIESAIKDIVTKKGVIRVDERNSRVIVDDIPSHMDKIKTYIEALDQPDRLVYIQAEIVDMDYQKSLDLGIDWSYSAGYNITKSTTGSVAIDILKNNFQQNVRDFFNTSTSVVNLSFGATAKASSSLGANSELLASPRIMVKNDEEGQINIGGTQPYSTLYTQPVTGTTGTSYQQYYSQTSQEYGLKLTVKPHINADGVIDMKVSLENTSADPVTLNPNTSSQFSGVKTTTAKASTYIQVHNHETVVIGGLVTKNKTESGSGIPLLEDIPLIGPVLFGSRSKGDKKRNLILFLTPHVVTGKRVDSEQLYPDFYKALSTATTESAQKKGKKDLVDILMQEKKDKQEQLDNANPENIRPTADNSVNTDSVAPNNKANANKGSVQQKQSPMPQAPDRPGNKKGPKNDEGMVLPPIGLEITQ